MWARSRESDGHRRAHPLLRVDPQIDVDLRPRIELADRLGIALVTLELCVNFVVHVWRNRRKPVIPVRAHDKRLYRASAGVGEINYRARKWSILFVDHPPGQQAASVAFVLG